MNLFELSTIVPGVSFSEDLWLDVDEDGEGYILASPQTPVFAPLLRQLEQWGYSQVKSEGSIHEEKIWDNLPDDDSPSLQEAAIFYDDLIEYTAQLYSGFAGNAKFDLPTLMTRAIAVETAVKTRGNFILRVMQNSAAPSEENYQGVHAAKSAIIAMIIGIQLKLTHAQLVDLTAAALLHEAGMVLLPDKIYLNSASLPANAWQAVSTHPLLGYRYLRKLGVPDEICIPALQHHERINGEGYPQRLKNIDISLYSRIIAAACSYEALSAERPFRKEAKNSHEALLEILGEGKKGYDDAVVKALVRGLSIYPIGMRVLLSDGAYGEVFSVNPASLLYPIVLTAEGKVSTAVDGVKIERPLTQEEIDAK
jgi:HD-GYP domain-containing protein (c-di-GMP phosphodiesterase class II)